MSLANQDRARQGKNISDDDISTEISLDELLEAAHKRWPLLTDNDLTSVLAHKDALAVGNYEGLVGRMRERYRLNETEAQREVDAFVQSFLVPTQRLHSSHHKMQGPGRD